MTSARPPAAGPDRTDAAILGAVRQLNARLRPSVEAGVRQLGACVLPAVLLLVVVPAVAGLGWLWLPAGVTLAAALVWALNRWEIARTADRLRQEALDAAQRIDPACDAARLKALCAARPWAIRPFPTDPGIAHRILVALGLPAKDMARVLQEMDGRAVPPGERREDEEDG